MPRFHIIIPARYESSRLPGKPLLDIGGKPMIQYVVECARRSTAHSITVATDDPRIEQAIQSFGGDVVMTSPHHACGTDRIAESIDRLVLADDDIVVNLQGDEPDMPSALIEQVAELLAHQPQAVMATASAPLDEPAHWSDPAVVKVVTDHQGYALYFSRAAIPWQSGAWRSEALPESSASIVRRHLGIYAYRCDYLRRFAERPACALEKHEKLEQLRALWYGEKIACAEAVAIPSPGIDTPADLERARRAVKSAH